MTYQQELEAMTDGELNFKLSQINAPKIVRGFEIVDYCNDWDALMPLIVAYKISLINEYGQHYSGNFGYKDNYLDDYENSPTINPEWDVSIEHKNPKRALAECLLRVLEKENDNRII